jgi:hypothetical protein
MYEQLWRLHRLLPKRRVREGLQKLWFFLGTVQLRGRQLWHLPCRQLQQCGRIQLLGLQLLCGLRFDGDGLDSVCLQPVPCRLRVLWRRRRRHQLLLLARLRVDGDGKLLLHGHTGHVCGLLAGERVRRR